MSKNPILVVWTELHELTSEQLACLSADETNHANHFNKNSRRRQFQCGRTLLRASLQRFTGEPASSHKLTTERSGKPICSDGPAVSISHSGPIVICAIAEFGDIGIDIEIPGRRVDTSGIAENYFAVDEAAWLATQPENRFYMLWVLKEAWLKARGTGIAGGLDRLRCRVTPPDIDASEGHNEKPRLRLFALDDRFVGLAATGSLDPEITICYWSPGEMSFRADRDVRLVAST